MSFPKEIVKALSEDAARQAAECLNDSDSARFELWHEDDQCRIDLACQVFGHQCVSGDGYNTPPEIYYTDVKVIVSLSYSDPPLSDEIVSNLTDSIHEEIVEYLLYN